MEGVADVRHGSSLRRVQLAVAVGVPIICGNELHHLIGKVDEVNTLPGIEGLRLLAHKILTVVEGDVQQVFALQFSQVNHDVLVCDGIDGLLAIVDADMDSEVACLHAIYIEVAGTHGRRLSPTVESLIVYCMEAYG